MATYDPSSYAPAPPTLDTRPRQNSSGSYRPRAYSNAAPDQPDPNLLGPFQQPQYPPVAPQSQQVPPYPQQMSFPPPPHDLLPGQAALPEHMQPAYMHEESFDPSRPRNDYERRPSHSSQRSHHSHHSQRVSPPYEEGYTRPQDDYERRPSHSSQRSHHSHHSHHSQRPSSPYGESYSRPREDYQRRPSHSSQHSHHSRRSHDVPGERDSREYRREDSESGDERYDRDERKYRKARKTKEEPRSLGGSLFGVFDILKSALGPRDKP